MSGYGISVFALSAVLGVLGLLSYRQGGDGAQRFAFAVLLCVTVAMPLSEGVRELSSLGQITDVPTDEYSELYASVAEEAFAAGLCQQICSHYGLDPSEVELRLSGFDFSAMSAERVTVTLSGSAATADSRSIKEYIKEQGIRECDVLVEFR